METKLTALLRNRTVWSAEVENFSPFEKGGLAFGHTHEWFGTIPPLSLFSTLIRNGVTTDETKKLQEKYIIWIGKSMWPSPYVLVRSSYFPERCPGKDLSREENAHFLFTNSLFIHPTNEKELLWTVEAALRSPVVAAVVAEMKTSLLFRNGLSISRRLALAAREGRTLGLFYFSRNLSEERESIQSIPTCAATRWIFSPASESSSPQDFLPQWNLTLLKAKGKQPATYEWRVAYGNNEALPLSLSSSLVDQSRSQVSSRHRYG
jgi:hypothetical protein